MFIIRSTKKYWCTKNSRAIVDFSLLLSVKLSLLILFAWFLVTVRCFICIALSMFICSHRSLPTIARNEQFESLPKIISSTVCTYKISFYHTRSFLTSWLSKLKTNFLEKGASISPFYYDLCKCMTIYGSTHVITLKIVLKQWNWIDPIISKVQLWNYSVLILFFLFFALLKICMS